MTIPVKNVTSRRRSREMKNVKAVVAKFKEENAPAGARGTVNAGFRRFLFRSPRGKANAASMEQIDYAALARQSVYDHSLTAKSGVPAQVFKRLAADVQIDQSVLAERLGIPRSTLSRKLAGNTDFSVSESERVLGILRLVGQVQAMLPATEEAHGFDAAAWFGRWLNQPLPALANKPPMSLLDTVSGQEVVSNFLKQMQSGSFA